MQRRKCAHVVKVTSDVVKLAAAIPQVGGLNPGITQGAAFAAGLASS